MRTYRVLRCVLLLLVCAALLVGCGARPTEDAGGAGQTGAETAAQSGQENGTDAEKKEAEIRPDEAAKPRAEATEKPPSNTPGSAEEPAPGSELAPELQAWVEYLDGYWCSSAQPDAPFPWGEWLRSMLVKGLDVTVDPESGGLFVTEEFKNTKSTMEFYKTDEDHMRIVGTEGANWTRTDPPEE